MYACVFYLWNTTQTAVRSRTPIIVCGSHAVKLCLHDNRLLCLLVWRWWYPWRWRPPRGILLSSELNYLLLLSVIMNCPRDKCIFYYRTVLTERGWCGFVDFISSTTGTRCDVMAVRGRGTLFDIVTVNSTYDLLDFPSRIPVGRIAYPSFSPEAYENHASGYKRSTCAYIHSTVNRNRVDGTDKRVREIGSTGCGSQIRKLDKKKKITQHRTLPRARMCAYGLALTGQCSWRSLGCESCPRAPGRALPSPPTSENYILFYYCCCYQNVIISSLRIHLRA
jgi:hypothetical protein